MSKYIFYHFMEIERHHFVTIDSTNTWALRHVQDLNPNKLTLVTAGTQTAGRGRFKRRWESPPDQNIYATFCFFLAERRIDIGNIPQILALSCVSVLEALNFKPLLKWPNDILLSGKKVAGILCETTHYQDKLAIVIGIGLNVNMRQELLEKIDRPATSLMVESQTSIEIEPIIKSLAKEFNQDIEIYLETGFSPFIDIYVNKQVLKKGQFFRFHDNQTIWEGFFDSINKDGSLNMALADGKLKTFIAGEIIQ